MFKRQSVDMKLNVRTNSQVRALCRVETMSMSSNVSAGSMNTFSKCQQLMKSIPAKIHLAEAEV